MTLERDLQRQVVEYAERTGWTAWQMLLGTQRGGSVWCTKGIPDLYVFRPGCAVWIELKRGKAGRVSPEQQQRHAELTAAGHDIHVARTFDEARTILDARRVPRPRMPHGARC